VLHARTRESELPLKLKRILQILLVAVACALLIAVSACTSVPETGGSAVALDRDGSGTARLVLEKAEGSTLESMTKRLNELSVILSNDDDRFVVTSVTEEADCYVAEVKLRRVQYTAGLGDLNYVKAKNFLLEKNMLELVKNYAKGYYSAVQDYKNLYEFDPDGILFADSTRFLPVNAITGKEMTVDEFNAAEGMLSESNNGRVFTFRFADIPGLKEITFSFKGQIKAYGAPDAEMVDESTITIRPVVETATIMVKTPVLDAEGNPQYDDNGNLVTEFVKQKIDVNTYAGYVYFVLEPNPVLIYGGIGLGAVIIGLILAGIFTGAFKRFFTGKTWKSIIHNWDLYLMMVPAAVLLILFAYLPMGGVVLAFKNYKVDDGIWASEWATMGGFKHFYDLITEPTADFMDLARNTFILALLKFIFGFLCAILLAVLFSYLKPGLFKKSVQTISYFPYFISWVVISGIAYLFLQTDGGILNNILTALKLEPIQWYTSPQYWRTILTFTALWKTVGYSTIVYLAAITAINPSLYEAAAIDGAGRWRQLVHITVPGLFPVIGVQIVFSLGNLVRDDFDQIYTMTQNQASLRETTEVIGTIAFRSIGSPNAYSSAAAMGLMQGLAALIIVFVSNKIVKRMGVDGVF